MDSNQPLNSYKTEDSESSCSCEEYDSSDSSICSCQYDSTCSSYYNSPKWVTTNSKLDKNVLKKFSFIEELSKSYESDNPNHVLLNKAPSLVHRNSVSDPEFLFTSKNTKSFFLNSESNFPTLSDFNSKELKDELREIESLLSDTHLFPPPRRAFPFRRRSNSSVSLPSNNSNVSSSPELRTKAVTTFPLSPTVPSNPTLNSWPSGFNTPKLSLQDSDYEDPEKLFSMLVSLDLFTYMYVLENVLDRKVREELAQS